ADARPHTNAHTMARNLECGRSRTSAALIFGFRVDVHAGFFLQRDFLHLRPCLDALLRCAGTKRWRLSFTLRGRQFFWPAPARPLLRHHWAKKNDRSDVRNLRSAARAERLAVS